MYNPSKSKTPLNFNILTGSLTNYLDAIPFRAYYKNGSQKYIKASLNYNNITKMSVLTSRGCLFNCSFCYNHVMRRLVLGKYYRRRSVDNVIEEIKELIKLFPNLNNIVFSDNVFAGYKTKECNNWIDEFSEKYRFQINMPFRCFGHFSGITSDILTKLKSAGCYMITLGFQSGSERIREKYLNKHETNEQIIEATRLISKSGIIGRYDKIRNIPYADKTDEKEENEFISRLSKPFLLREFNLLNHPGTDLTNRMLKDEIITVDQIEGICSTAYKKTVKIIEYK